MGLNIRPVSARIANGSRLVVSGQPTTGSKVFPITFTKKSNPYSSVTSGSGSTLPTSGSTTN